MTRTTKLHRIIIALVCCLSVSPALGQRSQAGRSSPSTPGGQLWTPVQSFQSQSFGTADLPSQRPADGAGILGSSIYRSGVPLSAHAPTGGGLQTAKGPTRFTQRQVQYHDPMTPLVSAPSSQPHAFVPRTNSDSSHITTLLSRRAAQSLAPTRPPLTSLAPPQEGPYRQTMLAGEAALKQKDYAAALERFQAAVTARRDTPEAHLSMAHAYLAAAHGDYTASADALGRTVRVFALLPLATVHPKDFLADEAEYQRIRSALDQHVAGADTDANAMFVLGYLQWRDGQVTDAVNTLMTAATKADSPELLDSINRMLRGMVTVRRQLTEDAPPLQPAEDYSQAGIRLSLPQGYRHVRLQQINRVVIARGGGEESPRQIALSVFPLAADTTLRTLVDSATEHLNCKLGVSKVMVEADSEVPFLGGVAHVRTFGCDYGGKAIVAARLCFIREPEPTDTGQTPRLGYVLGMGVNHEEADILLPSLAAVSRSIEFTEFVRPVSLPVDSDGYDVVDTQWGFSLFQPKGWAGSFNDRGFAMGRFDNLMGGAVTPRVEVVVSKVRDTDTPEGLGASAIAAKAGDERRIVVISQGVAQLGDIDGYEFVTQEAHGDRPLTVEISRLICEKSDDGPNRLYALVVRCQGATVDQARSIMDAVAPTFALSQQAFD